MSSMETKNSRKALLKTRVPLLNVDRGSVTIAGVQINNAHHSVPNESKRAIEEAIGKLGKVNVEYRGKGMSHAEHLFCVVLDISLSLSVHQYQ